MLAAGLLHSRAGRMSDETITCLAAAQGGIGWFRLRSLRFLIRTLSNTCAPDVVDVRTKRDIV